MERHTLLNVILLIENSQVGTSATFNPHWDTLTGIALLTQETNVSVLYSSIDESFTTFLEAN